MTISVKKAFLVLLSISFAITTTSCKKKKLTEVVEVPLPTKEEKMTLGSPEDVIANEGAFSLVKIPYKYDALSPNIDAMTMQVHYSRHYLTYTNNLNKALAGTDLESLPIEELHKKLDMSNADLRNNLGGYYNHSLYFEIITPKGEGKPKDSLASAIDRDFGSFENFKTQFSDAANKQFGSGWAWLVVDKTGKLQVTSTPNQDNPLMPKQVISGTPILAIDVWEHAYYLSYQNKRKNYIDNFYKIIDWKKVSEKFDAAIKK
ncbi:superoxide dismutase [Flavobacterium sp.]|uniref:superoxide dismutase n=1 Tax=Flavobacterium sp. TaxID=239 RepID=UPI0026362930|nr:superoxide dismutase [Flavobacterium sp.]